MVLTVEAARTAPQQWTARNRLATHAELHTPLR